MQIKFQVDRRAAVKRGINATSQIVTLDVDPAQLNEEDRLYLAERLTQAGEVCTRNLDGSFRRAGGYTYPTVEELDRSESGTITLLTAQGITVADVLAAIRAEDAAVKAAAEKRLVEESVKKAEKAQRTKAVLDAKKVTRRHEWAKVSRLKDGTLKVVCENYSAQAHEGRAEFETVSPDWPYKCDEDTLTSANATTWLAELDAANAVARDTAIKAATADLIEREAAAEEQAKLAAQALKARGQQIDAWVDEHGSESQKARHEEGLLSESEVIDAIREEAFAPVKHRALYKKITAADVCECEGREEYDAEPCGLTCEVEDDCPLTESEYADLCVFRGFLPDATITPKLHECQGKKCDGTCERKSLHVKIVVGAFKFAREYAV